MSFRNLYFYRQIRKLSTLERYGGIENLNAHGTSKGWKNMLLLMIAKGIAKPSTDSKGAVIIRSEQTADSEFIKRLKLDSRMHDKLIGVN